MPFPLPKWKPEFSKLEESILQYWKDDKTFEKSVESRSAENPYRFYDGPPFITGTPHYGSLLSSIIKDVIPRYQTMLGKRVERVWGWDCHGLPIEQKVQKKMWLESNKEIEESEGGIQKFIDECYNYTRDTSSEWGWYIDHIGRWVDMEHAYRTMDQDYMESVMWVFKQIWEKGYVYEGKRVSWYSWKLSTPISNFEIAMDDSYQDVQDPAVTIKFPILGVKKGAASIIQDEDGKLLLIKNKKDGLWRLPGGNIEPGESYHDGAARELLEETGITCALAPYCTTYGGYRGGFYEALSFRGTVPVGQKVILEDKFTDYEYFALDALPIRSEIHRMEHDLLDFLTGVREPVTIPEFPESRTVNILAWTTTPWTMPMHMALAVHRELLYVAVYHAEEVYIVAASRVETVFKGKGDYQILCTVSGDELVWLSYRAPFHFYQKQLIQDPREIDEKQGGRFEYTDEGRLRYVLAVIRNEKGEILMLQNIKHGLNWQCPGGKIDAGESAEAALKREVKEELWIDIHISWKLGDYHCQTGGGTYWQGEYFDATYTGKPEILEPHKHAQMQWVSIVPDDTKKSWFHMDFADGAQLLDDEVLPKTYDANALFALFKGESNVVSGPDLGKSFRVYHADFVTDTDGTGIAHEAPEFGDVDFQLAKAEWIHITNAIDEAGKYTAEIPEYAGMLYLDAIEPICERMKSEGTLFKKESITHRVPYCPRSNTPLIQKAQKSWFIDIQRIKSELIAQNESINWFPDHFKHGRFLKSLESAPDWCISRSRFWGTPMPVWQNSDGSERVVIDSREELYQRNKPLGQITKFIFVRHGESEGNVGKYFAKPETPLTKNGQAQAKALIEALKDDHIDVIISSPFTRTLETAEPVADALGIEIITDERICEWNVGCFLGIASDSPEAKEDARRSYCELEYVRWETGETRQQLVARCEAFLQEITQKYAGKTVAFFSHNGFGKVLFSSLRDDSWLNKNLKNCEIRKFYIDNNTGKEINLHRPYIDRIYLPAEEKKEKRKEKKGGIKKVLGVHGYNKHGNVVDFFAKTKEVLAGEGVHMDAPFFESGESVDYKNWEKVFDGLDLESYDTWVTHSMGAKIARQYIVSHGLHLKRMILVSPRYEASSRSAMAKVEQEQLTHTFEELRQHVDEIVVISSEDDPVVPHASEKKVAETLGATLVTVNGAGHFNTEYSPLITGIIQHGAPLRRIPEVLDVWMDSASMPYAQVHYPFENQEKMEASFPADFIAEYTGQIRAWFYVMHVIGVLVKGSPAFKNVAVTGVINGTDGRKMSKSFGNYPDPRETIEKYGADAIRFYLMGGTLMKGEDMTFSEAGIQEAIKRVLLPLWNSYTFFATYANIDGWEFTEYKTKKTHELDTWIISRLHTLIRDVRGSMDVYDLQKTCDAVMVFLDGLNNWYIRRNRRRFWKNGLDADKKSAYETLHEVLVTVTKLLAPICPFITEHLYQNLMDTQESVHLTGFPEVNKKLIDEEVNQKMADLQALTNLGLAIRGREKLRVRQPLRSATITLPLDDSARETLAEELNVKEIHTIKDVSEYVTITYSPDAKKIGATERKQWMKTIIADAKAGKGVLTTEGVLELTVPETPEGKVILAPDEFEAVYTPKEGSTIAFAGNAGYVIGLDTTLDEALTLEWYARDMIRWIQDARKELGFQVTDRLQLSLASENEMLGKILATHQSMIEKETLTTIDSTSRLRSSDLAGMTNEKELEIDEGFVVSLTLQK